MPNKNVINQYQEMVQEAESYWGEIFNDLFKDYEYEESVEVGGFDGREKDVTMDGGYGSEGEEPLPAPQS